MSPSTLIGEVHNSTQIQDQALHQWHDEKEQSSPSDTTTSCLEPQASSWLRLPEDSSNWKT